MTVDRARERLQVQANFGGFYNRNSAWLILVEVHTVGRRIYQSGGFITADN